MLTLETDVHGVETHEGHEIVAIIWILVRGRPYCWPSGQIHLTIHSPIVRQKVLALRYNSSARRKAYNIAVHMAMHVDHATHLTAKHDERIRCTYYKGTWRTTLAYILLQLFRSI